MFTVCTALHACGNATDMSMESALRSSAAYIMCPCCVGKLKFSIEGGTSKSVVPASGASRVLPHVTHPRSNFFLQALPTPQASFAMIARAADVSHAPTAAKKPRAERAADGTDRKTGAEGGERSNEGDRDKRDGEMSGKDEALRRLSKLHVELDRTLAFQERGYKTALFKLIHPHLTAKNDLLVGAPVDSAIAAVVARVWEACTPPSDAAAAEVDLKVATHVELITAAKLEQ